MTRMYILCGMPPFLRHGHILRNIVQLAFTRVCCIIILPYCPAVTPPLFATYFQDKEGGGRNNEDMRFRLAIKPPPPPPPTHPCTEIDEALLCSRRELLRSTCRGSTEGWKSHWPRTCCKTQQVVSQPDSSHRPQDYTAG